MVVLIGNGLFYVCAGLVKAPLKRSRSTADGGDEDGPEQLQELLECGAVDDEQKTDNTTLLRLLEEGEKVNKLSHLFTYLFTIWFKCCVQCFNMSCSNVHMLKALLLCV